MQIKRIGLAAAVVLAWMCAPSTATARQGEAADWARRSEAHASLLDLDFPGGSLVEYYNGIVPILLESSRPQNIIISPQAKFVEMPAFTARSMLVADAVNLPGSMLTGVDVEMMGAGFGFDIAGADGKKPAHARTYVISVDMSKAYTSTPEDRSDTPRISIDFPGGSLDAYIQLIRDQAHGMNIVVAPEASNASVGPVRLRDAPAPEALWILQGRPAGAGVIEIVQRKGGLFLVEVARRPEKTRVWSLAEHLNSGMNADDLLAGAEAAMGAVGLGGALRFHPPTAMLIARGSPEQIEAVEQAVTQMHLLASRRQERKDRLHAQLDAAEQALSDIVSHLPVVEKQVEVAQSGVAETRETMGDPPGQESALTAEQIALAELKVVEAQAELERVQSEVERRRRRLERLRAQLDALDD